MRTKRALTISAVVVALAAIVTISIFRVTQHVQAQDVMPPRPDHFSFGMVGITPGQTLRINVANTLTANDSNYPPGPSRVAIIVVNSRGQVVRNRDGSPVRKVEMLDRGDSTFLDLNADDFPVGAGGRFQVRAVVNVFPPGPSVNGIPYDSAVPSIEVFNNNNGRTVFSISNPGVIRGFNPQPDPPL